MIIIATSWDAAVKNINFIRNTLRQNAMFFCQPTVYEFVLSFELNKCSVRQSQETFHSLTCGGLFGDGFVIHNLII